LLTLSATLDPAASFLPGRGFWEMTRPFVTRAEYALVTFPTEQCARLIALLAARSVLPFTLGTTHRDGGGGVWFCAKLAVTGSSAFSVTVQLPLPEQAPDQPAKEEPAAAEAVRVTVVP